MNSNNRNFSSLTGRAWDSACRKCQRSCAWCQLLTAIHQFEICFRLLHFFPTDKNYIHNNTGLSICPTPLLMQTLYSISVDNSNKQLKPTNHTIDTINIYKLNSENLIVWHTTLGKTQSTQKIIECYKSKQNKQTTHEITLFHNILTSCTNVFNSGNANY